jgi:radical SAM protein with 4Fe4S-binding SPASM domain
MDTISQERVRELKKHFLDKVAVKKDELYKEPDLRHLFLELTTRCNEHCFHCGSRCASDMCDGLPLIKYKELVDEVSLSFDPRRVQFCITGGEPMLYPDFYELMEYISQKGFRWGMTSNATLIDKEAAHRLREAGMGTISVSIDGLEETHDKQRGLKGGYKLAMQGIQNLIDEHFFHEIQITTVVNHRNIDELDALYDIIRDIDVDSWRVIGIEPIGRALEHSAMLLTPDDHRRIFDFILKKRQAQIPVSYGCAHFLGIDLEHEVRDWFFLCNAGIYTASIRAGGNICACLDEEETQDSIQGNILRDRFTDVWKNGFKAYRTHLSYRNSECSECSYENWCRGGARHSWDPVQEKQRICFKGILFD